MRLDAFFGSPDHMVVETACGPMLCFRRDTGCSASLAEFGEYAAEEVSVYRYLLKPGDVVIDVGANIGAVSAALLRDGRGYQIWAFEPQPAFHALATVNLMAASGARVLPMAVGAEDGLIQVPEIDIRQTGNYGGIGLDTRSGLTVPSPLVRLDTFLHRHRCRPPRLIKIDVEGMEASVIEGARGLWHPELVLSIEADRPSSINRWLPALLDEGVTCYLMIFGSISTTNPKFDLENPACRVHAPHVVAFVGTPDPTFDRWGARLSSLDECLSRLAPVLERSRG